MHLQGPYFFPIYRSIHKTNKTMLSKADAFSLDDRYCKPRIEKKLCYACRTSDSNSLSLYYNATKQS
jgi:hypothetical protein